MLDDDSQPGSSQQRAPAGDRAPEAPVARVDRAPGALVEAPEQARQRPCHLHQQQEAARRQGARQVLQRLCTVPQMSGAPGY